MKIQKIQSIDFQGKRKAGIVISENMRSDIQKLMYNMNHDTKYKQSENGNCFRSYIVGAVKIDKKAMFMDNRFLCAPTEAKRISEYPDCSIEFGRSIIDMNSQTGEVYTRKKPFWKSLKRVLKQGHEHIKRAIENYNNSEVVEKRGIGIAGVTEKGAEILEGAKKRAGVR